MKYILKFCKPKFSRILLFALYGSLSATLNINGQLSSVIYIIIITIIVLLFIIIIIIVIIHYYLNQPIISELEKVIYRFK